MIDMSDYTPARNLRTSPGPGKPAPEKQTYWRSFPTSEKLLDQEHGPILDRIQATCRQLDGILKQSSAPERARAQSVIAAYTRALELHRELVHRRDEIFAPT